MSSFELTSLLWLLLNPLKNACQFHWNVLRFRLYDIYEKLWLSETYSHGGRGEYNLLISEI